MRMGRVLGAAAVVGAGVLAYRAMQKRKAQRSESREPAPMPEVRDAGPDAMDQPPKRWSVVDQQADESFPASDPPGNY